MRAAEHPERGSRAGEHEPDEQDRPWSQCVTDMVRDQFWEFDAEAEQQEGGDAADEPVAGVTVTSYTRQSKTRLVRRETSDGPPMGRRRGRCPKDHNTGPWG